VFVADTQGTVIAKADSAAQPSAFAKWLDEQSAAYERTHPTTKVPLIRAQVEAEGEGDARKVTCQDLDSAREAGQPVLIYVGRSSRPDDTKKERGVSTASRKFEKATLGSKKAAAAAGGFVLLRLDVGDPDHALLAKALGAEKLPTLLLWSPKAEQPEDLGGRISGASLASKLKKLAAAIAGDGSDDE